MYDGIYEVSFSTSPGREHDFGHGIVTIKAGSMNGGDQAYVYKGLLKEQGEKTTGRIQVSKWSTATTSVLLGLDYYELEFSGEFSGGDSLNGWGVVVGQNDLTLHIFAHKLSDAV
jgi:hypothetical protein